LNDLVDSLYWIGNFGWT